MASFTVWNHRRQIYPIKKAFSNGISVFGFTAIAIVLRINIYWVKVRACYHIYVIGYGRSCFVMTQ